MIDNFAFPTHAPITSLENSRSGGSNDEYARELRERIGTIPTTRFYGSKRRLLPWLARRISPFRFQNFLDVFGGTASTSLLFRAMNADVTFHDGLLCNCISAHALLNSHGNTLSLYDFSTLIDSVVPQRGFIARTFPNIFFEKAENEWLDGAVETFSAQNSLAVRAILFHCLFQACLRKRPFNLFHRANLYLRTASGIHRSFGNATTWAAPFSKHMAAVYNEMAALSWRDSSLSTILVPQDVFALPEQFDAVYLDPPYIRKNRAPLRYLTKYHFLEGLSRYEEWPFLIDPSSKIKSFRPSYLAGDWELKSNFRERLFALVAKFRKSHVLLSYADGGYPARKEIESFFGTMFGRVHVFSNVITHALNSRAKRELLFVGVPK